MSMRSFPMIMPVFNQWHLTERCLHSLLENSHNSHDFVVIDNGSQDETPQKLQTYVSRFEAAGWSFRVERLDPNRGFGRAMNHGLRTLKEHPHAYRCLLNNDIWVSQGWDQALLDAALRGGWDLTGPYYDEKKPFSLDRLLEECKRFTKRNKNRTISEWCSIVMLLKNQTLEEIGAFDERYFLTFEDTDLKERFDRAGKTYAIIGDAFIWHSSKGTRSKDKNPSAYEVEGLRLFKEKWGFDPRPREYTVRRRLERRFQKVRRHFGYL